MKILYKSFEIMNLLLNNDVPVGGAAVEWYNWLKGFHKIGIDIGILTWKGANEKVKEKEFNYDLVESFDLNKGLPKIRFLTYRLPSYYKAIKNYKPDFIIQGCATEDTGYMALLAKTLNIKFIHRIGSDMDVDGRIENNFPKLSMKIYYWGIKNADHISCQNQYQYNMLKKKYPQKSISINYNPFNFKEYEIQPQRNRNYIAWIGNFRYEKNLPALAKIAKLLPNKKFKIAGTKFINTDHDASAGLTELEKLPNVEFLGHIDNSEITKLLSNAYCLLNTSRLEGFSNTFLEAWSVGTPVVTTKFVNPDGIITKHYVGLVAETYEQLDQKVSELYNYSNTDYQKLSINCKNYVKQNHNPELLAQQFLKDMIAADHTKKRS